MTVNSEEIEPGALGSPTEGIRPEADASPTTLQGASGERAPEKLLDDPVRRRWWLLKRATTELRLDIALQVAAQAEAFVFEGKAPPASDNPASDNGVERPGPEARNCNDDESRCGTPTGDTASAAEPVKHCAGNHLDGLLPSDRKAELQRNLAAGKSNAEVGAQFGLTPRQVQGFRMQLARAANRHARSEGSDAATGATARACRGDVPFVEDVVRYLRQQGDVIVRSGQFGFLVNNRFHLDFDQLLIRANRMRARQGKPELRAIGQPGNAAAEQS